MKKILLSLCFTLAPGFAQEANAPAAPAPAQTAEPTVEELRAQLIAQLQTAADLIAELHQIIFSITDEESADAAAPLLHDCIERMAKFKETQDETTNRLTRQLKAKGVNVEELVLTLFPETILQVKQCEARIADLAAMDPPFYGSEPLMQGLRPLTPVSYVSPQGSHSTPFDNIETGLHLLADGLASLGSKTAADGFAENVSAMSFSVLINVLEFDCDANDSTSPEMVEWMRQIKADVQVIAQADTYGSEALDWVLWGWRHIRALWEQHEDTQLFWNCVCNYSYFTWASQELDDILMEVSDKETADEHAGDVHNVLHGARAAKSGGGVYEPAPEEFEAWISGACDCSWSEAETSIKTSLDSLKANDYYGSEALRTAAGVYDCPELPFDEQVRIYSGYLQKSLGYMTEMRDILLTIKDKESADAAAPRLKELRDGLETVVGEMNGWMNGTYLSNDLMPAVYDTISALIGMSEEVDSLSHKLYTMDPPFFGSEELQDAAPRPEEEE